MTRDLVLSLLVGTAALVTIGAWVYAPPPPEPQAPPAVPAEIFQRIEKLEAAQDDAPLVPEPEPVPEPAPPPPAIERISVNGQDLADLLGLSIWKFRFRLPAELKDSTAYVWLERWTRDDDEPEYELLETTSGQWTEDELVIKLPDESDTRLFIRIDQIANLSPPRQDPLLPPQPIRWSVLDRQSLKLGEPIHLITVTHNATAAMKGGLRDVHRDHDVTVYIKVAFIEGAYVPFEPGRWIPGNAP